MNRISRKLEHVSLAVQSQGLTRVNSWQDVRFVHYSLPEMSVDQVSLSTTVAGRNWPVPLYINAMTGGALGTETINGQLAQIAREHRLPMAVGSQHAGLERKELERSYKVVRTIVGDGLVLANLGAGVPAPAAQSAVDMLEANYLQLHLNAPQELIMPEGDRDFTGILRSIETIVHSVQVPVIVKEVGFGMCSELYDDLLSVGVSVVDVGGRGGTNFAWIENQRRTKSEYRFLENWGQTTLESLLEAQGYAARLEWLASGGVRSPLEMSVAFALGARAVGVSGPLLRVLQEEGIDAASNLVQAWLDGIKTMLTVLGARDVHALQKKPLVISGQTAQWCELRGINIRSLAQGPRN